MKRPAFQFYPADWRKDPSLSTCSLAARGLWIELMCIMHEASPYGVLAVNGKPMTDLQISRAVGEPMDLVQGLLDELESAGVYSRDETGAIFSRRMIRDEQLRNVRAAAGRLGGNPTLLNQKHNLIDKQKPTPSSSSSSSTSEDKTIDQPTAVARVNIDSHGGDKGRRTVSFTPEYEEWWSAYPRKVGKLAAFRAYQTAKRLLGVEATPRLLLGAQAYAATTAGKDEKYIAHPTTWLNQGRWDDVAASKRAGAVGRDAFGVGG